MNAFSIIKYVFGAVGLVLCVVAFFLYQNTQDFLTTALNTEGTVVDLVSSYSSDSTTYSPVIEYKTRKGEHIRFTTTFSSNPPAYTRGEKVTVYYQENRPEQAEIDGWFSLWGLPIILGSIGSIFFLIGTGIFIAERLKARKMTDLQLSGMAVQAKITSIGLNTMVSSRGSSPFVIHAQWQNPATSQVHIFQSDDIWFDPTDFVQSGHINVLIDRDNPSHYYMDISFLPKLAE